MVGIKIVNGFKLRSKTICGWLITRAEKENGKSKFLTIGNIHSRTTFMIGWAKDKGDYWYDTDPNTAKFFSFGKKVHNTSVQRGAYIGRLGIVIMRRRG